MTDNFFNKVKQGLAGSESGGNYQAVYKSETNPALGKYQFTRGRLSDLGYGNITNEDFLNSPDLQEEVMGKHLEAAYGHMKKNGLVQGKLDGREAGLLWSYHLGGYGGAVKASQGQQGPSDALGTTPLKYLHKGQRNFEGNSGGMLIDEPDTTYVPLDRAAPLPRTVTGEAAFKSAFAREDIYTAAIDMIKSKPSFTFDSNYNPFDAEDIKKYEPIWDQLEEANNEEEATLLKQDYDTLVKDSENQFNGGAASIAGALVAGAISPLNFVPGLGILNKSLKVANLAKATTTTKAAIGAATTAGIVGAEEGVLQLHDPTRQASESVAAILTAGAIGAVATPLLIKHFNNKQFKSNLQDQLSDSIETSAQKEYNKGATHRLKYTDCDV